MRRLLLLCAMFLVPVAAHAEVRPPAWEGVWRGTVGRLPVRACFQQTSDTYRVGSYYYMSRMLPIALRSEDDGSWGEHEGGAEDASARWTIAMLPNGQLSGQWRQGRRVLPVALTRVAVERGADSACGSDAFSSPRLRPVRVTTRPGRKGDFAYTELNYDVGRSFPDVTITSFSYPASQPGDPAINAALRLDPGKGRGGDYYVCERGQLGSLGLSGSYTFSYEPVFASREFLSVQANEGGDCGGAHPSVSLWRETFDRQNGKRIDLKQWLTSAALVAGESDDDGSYAQVASALRQLVLRHARFEDAECREAVSQTDYWGFGLDARGMAFTPSLPHVAMACTDTFVVPMAELARFLSPAGREGARRLGR